LDAAARRSFRARRAGVHASPSSGQNVNRSGADEPAAGRITAAQAMIEAVDQRRRWSAPAWPALPNWLGG
jgi:hypothetical protein